jgi:hypothetical protein
MIDKKIGTGLALRIFRHHAKRPNMSKLYLNFALLGVLTACSDSYQPNFERSPPPVDSKNPSDSATEDDPVSESKRTDDVDPKATASTMTPAEPKPTPVPAPTPAPAPEFVVDPETLSFPVVFHLGGSNAWQTEEKLRPVVAEAQRILLQAKIEILPTYTKDMAPTENMDVFFVPQVPDQPGINGVSFGGGAPLEIYVIDNVGLSKVDDLRPAETLAPRYFKGAKPGDKVAVSAEEAEQGRTTAHEIGHQLGLPHRQNTTNLLASGTTGWTLNAAEIATVRATAVSQFKAKFVKTLP